MIISSKYDSIKFILENDATFGSLRVKNLKKIFLF